jgi:tellurite resistance protein TerC
MPLWIWSGFIVFVLVMLAVDLFFINRKAHVISTREALRWTAVTVVLALMFAGVVYYLYEHGFVGAEHAVRLDAAENQRGVGVTAMLEYLTGWIVEYSLSMDNIFVIALIFSYFRVPLQYQRRVLLWGVLGALVMRGVMIGVAGKAVQQYSWILYVFGGILLFTAVKLFFTGEQDVHPDRNFGVRIARRFFPVTSGYVADRFFSHVDVPHGQKALGGSASFPAVTPGSAVPAGHRRLAAVTPLFLALIVVETTDVVFAVDSIPAIFGITQDPFIVFTSNVFAILGLRSLYFALAAMMEQFRYLKTALVFVLAFIGVKMLLEVIPFHIPTGVSLAVVVGTIGAGVGVSMFASKRERARRTAPVDDLTEAALLAYRNSRRIVVLVLGLTILAFSIPIGLLPGPGGIAVAVGGLALLATEFVWARRLLKDLKRRTEIIAERADAILISNHPRVWLIPIVFAALGGAIYVAYHHMGLEGHWPRSILYASIGPVLAVCFWAYVTVKRYIQIRSGRYTVVPPPPGYAPAQGAPPPSPTAPVSTREPSTPASHP